jgi:hypothetical protein
MPWLDLVFFRIRLPKRKWRVVVFYVCRLEENGCIFIEEVAGMRNVQSNMTVPNANVRSKAL